MMTGCGGLGIVTTSDDVALVTNGPTNSDAVGGVGVGRLEGLDVGKSVGWIGLLVGYAVGDDVGLDDLTLTGLLEGLADGEASGLAVGKFVGPLVGLTDGEISGLAVGKFVGLLEGLAVGEASGEVVG